MQKILFTALLTLFSVSSFSQDTVYVFGADTMNSFDPLVYEAVDTNENLTWIPIYETYFDTSDVLVSGTSLNPTFTSEYFASNVYIECTPNGAFTRGQPLIITPNSGVSFGGASVEDTIGFDLVLHEGESVQLKVFDGRNSYRLKLWMEHLVGNTYDTLIVITLDKISSIHEVNELEFTSFPNPVNTTLTFTFDNTSALSEVNYSVYSMSGSLMKTGILENNTIDVSYLNAGIYTINLDLDGKTSRTSFLKQ